MKRTLFYHTTIAGIFLLGACSGFLKETSQDEVIPRTTADFRELLLGSGYPDNSPSTNFTYFFDDDVELGFQIAENIGLASSLQYFPMYTWQPYFTERDGLGNVQNENAGSTVYYGLYERIKGCNAVLDHIDAAIGPQEDKDRIRAEALAIRALHYFRLVNLYGEPYHFNKHSLGVPLKLNSTMDESFMPRNTVEEVYDTIVQSLKTACALMDPLPILRKNYRINQPAIHTLLSRVYLFMENWADCVTEAGEAIRMGAVLQTLTTGTFATSSYLNYNNPEIEWMFGSGSQAVQSPYVPAPEFLSIFDKTNDARYRYGFSVQFSGLVLLNKYPTGSLETKQNVRTAETYLNRAEASVQMNKLQDALADLNTLRRHRIVNYVDETITDKEALLEAIRTERRKEFCYENFRWIDLRRYGMPSITHRFQFALGEPVLAYTLKEKDPMYTLPFPSSLLLRNPALRQNSSAFMNERTGE